MNGKVRVLRLRSGWHWWCPCCMGGDWNQCWMVTIRQALGHAEAHRSGVSLPIVEPP